MNAKKTLGKFRGESDKASHSVYISRTIMAEFTEACGDITPSRVIEELMREFLDDLGPRKKKQFLGKVVVKKN